MAGKFKQARCSEGKTVTFAGMNYLAVLIAAMIGWVLGALYYGALAKPWLDAQGRTMEEVRRHQAEQGATAYIPYAAAFVAELIMAWVLAGVIGHLGIGQVTLRNGVISAAFLWFGFMLTTMAVNNLFGMRAMMLTVIDAGHWLLVMLTMGAIIGAMGV
jgi:Protein of unknown function (DUF1761)